MMKVDELKTNLALLDKGEIIKLATEFYKLIPKSKKEENNLDALILAGGKKEIKQASVKESFDLEGLGKEITTFIEHAKQQLYLYPNKIVSKQARTGWRFKVKAWYKELITTKNKGGDALEKQATLLTNLYELLSEACGYQYFSSDDPFQSIGISQTDFFNAALQAAATANGRASIVKRGITSITDYYPSRNTLYSYLMDAYVDNLAIPDVKYQALETLDALIKETQALLITPPANPKKRYFSTMGSHEEYKIKSKINHLAELGFRLHASLYEYKEAIEYYKTHAKQRDVEVLVYILISMLFELQLKDYIKSELQLAKQNDIKLRDSLLNLLNYIEKEDALPDYIR